MDAELEQLKQRLPLLEYLQRRNWTARRAGDQPEFVGLCPLHRETHPSFTKQVPEDDAPSEYLRRD